MTYYEQHRFISDYAERNKHKVLGKTCVADGCAKSATNGGIWCDNCRPVARPIK
jgi:hypothetical protein